MKSHHKRGERGGKGAHKKKEYIEEQEILVQPARSYSTYKDTTESIDEAKDFESFITTLPSTKGQFIFKSEKNWSAATSGCFDSFTLDLNLINAALKCIPFNECVRISDEYFTADQLTHFHNAAEEGKKAYKEILSNQEVSNSSNAVTSTKSLDNESKEPKKSTNLPTEIQCINTDNDNLDEDLDFLLSLKSANVQSDKKQTTLTNVLHNDDPKMQSEVLPTKSIDLESWLDSILDD